MTRPADVEQSYGMPLWGVIAHLASEGCSRAEVARRIGYRADSFSQLLKRHPDKDPFDSTCIPANYVSQTGESFGDALRRMAAGGMSKNDAAIAIGYSGKFALSRAMKARGLDIKFGGKRAKH